MDEHDRQAEADHLVRVRRVLLDAEMAGRGIGRRRGRKGRDPIARASFEALDHLRALEQIEGRSVEDRDAEERAVQLLRGKAKLKAAFYAVIGDPPVLLVGDRYAARAYHKYILRALDMGGWTHSEQTALTRLERVWRDRARGADPRFNLVGNRSGRLPAEVRARLLTTRGRQP